MSNVCIVPLAGEGSRFKDHYSEPKPMIQVDHRSIIEHSMESFDLDSIDKLIFIVRIEHIQNWHIDSFLKQKFGDKVIIVECDGLTKGAVETVLLAKNYIDKNDFVYIWGSDVKVSPPINLNTIEFTHRAGVLVTFKSNSPNYSYCKLNNTGHVIEVKEKKVISENANVGLYGFRRWFLFEEYAKIMQKKHSGELHIAPLYQYMIDDNRTVGIETREEVHIFGTPLELKFYKKIVLNRFDTTKSIIGLSADHSGWEMKEYFKTLLTVNNLKFIDFGCYSEKDTDYGDWTKRISNAFRDKIITHSILFCRTGQGQNIFINKENDIINAEIWDEYTMKMAIEHNGANSFSIPTKYFNKDLLIRLISSLIAYKFQGGRHQTRLMKSMRMI